MLWGCRVHRAAGWVFFAALGAGGEVVHVKFKPPTPSSTLLTVPVRWFCCGSLLPVFYVRVSRMFHITCVYIIFSSVSFVEWPPFVRWLLARLTICSHCSLTI